jgi:hypothetical protein
LTNERRPDAFEALRGGVRDAYLWFEATLSDVTEEHVNWRPPGMANPICAAYAHVVIGADFGVNSVINGRQPLIVSEWGGKVGLSEPMPAADWHEWASRVHMDLDVFRRYASAVYACWDDYLSLLLPENLDRTVHLYRMGQRSLAEYLVIQVEHFSGHCGEIACLKGLQGLTGFQPGTDEGIG